MCCSQTSRNGRVLKTREPMMSMRKQQSQRKIPVVMPAMTPYATWEGGGTGRGRVSSFVAMPAMTPQATCGDQQGGGRRSKALQVRNTKL